MPVKMVWPRRIGIAIVAFAVLLLGSYSWLVQTVGGAFDLPGSARGLSDGARDLVEQAFEDITPGRLKDYHVHIIGLNPERSGAWVNPALLNWWGLHNKIKGDVFLNSSGVSDLTKFDQQYMGRLTDLARRMPTAGTYQLLAFDYFYAPNGARSIEHSELYVPNDYVHGLTRKHPELFTAAVSVHPYRPDALQRIEFWAKRGVRFVKWLPNAQGINPDDPGLDDYYSALQRNQMILLTHVGEETAVSSTSDNQALGNPLLFTRALDRGVKVIMAHAGSAGKNRDREGVVQSNFELFMGMMDEPDYRANLFGDISAITQFNRLPGPLLGLLERTDIHHRLVNGSDYPLPAINLLVSTRLLAHYGLITEDQRRYLNEIYQDNPLLFDFVSKRILRHPTRGNGFPAAVFMVNHNLEGSTNY